MNMTTVELITISISALGVIVVPVVTSIIKHYIKRKEISRKIVWKFAEAQYEPPTKAYPERLTMTLENVSGESITIKRIKYGWCKKYAYKSTMICSDGEIITLPLIPNISDLRKYKEFCVISQDNAGYTHKTKFRIKTDKKSYNIILSFE